MLKIEQNEFNENVEQAREFVRLWAEAVVRQAEQARTTRKKAARDGRNHDRLEDWSPTAIEIGANFRAQWADEHTLIWTSYQLERWETRLRALLGQEALPHDAMLKNLRDALEHLDELHFEDGAAVPPPAAGNRMTGSAVRRLPGEKLWIELPDDGSFDGVDTEALEARARLILDSIEETCESEAEGAYLNFLEQ